MPIAGRRKSEVMKFWGALALIPTLCLVTPARADDYRVYAASRATSQLWIVEATKIEESLELVVVEKRDLGFPGSTITRHPEKPLLYLAAPFGDDSGNPGTTIELSEAGDYIRQHDRLNPNGYAYLSLDRARRFLLGSNYRGGQVDIFRLDGTGHWGERVGGLDEGRKNAHCVLTSPDNRFLYIPYVKDTNALYQYRFDPESGAVNALEPKNVEPPEGTGPRHLAYHPQLPFAYFSNEQGIGVSVYEKTESGHLELVQVCDAFDPPPASREGLSSSDIAITPDGRFLFVGVRGAKQDLDRIARFRVTERGTVELLGLTPADAIPWGFTLSPDGAHLLVSAFQGETLTVFAIGGKGGLEELAKLSWDRGITDLVTR